NFHVTGVQTCALPIFDNRADLCPFCAGRQGADPLPRAEHDEQLAHAIADALERKAIAAGAVEVDAYEQARERLTRHGMLPSQSRSEERRVGEEGVCRR